MGVGVGVGVGAGVGAGVGEGVGEGGGGGLGEIMGVDRCASVWRGGKVNIACIDSYSLLQMYVVRVP